MQQTNIQASLNQTKKNVKHKFLSIKHEKQINICWTILYLNNSNNFVKKKTEEKQGKTLEKKKNRENSFRLLQ